MVLAVAAPHKRRRIDDDSLPSDTDDIDDDDDDEEEEDEDQDVDSSRSPSPAAGAQAIAHMISSQRHPLHQNSAGAARSTRATHDSAVASSSSPSSKHQCDICSKTFARHEHMLRHRASHTDTASYSCQDCGKRFRRSDVLQRHRRLHAARKELSLDINSSKLTKRQRSALARVEAACLRCSSKKLKCDAAKPSCSRCLRKPGVACVYPPSSDPSPLSSSTRPEHTDDSWLPDADNLDFTANAPSPLLNSTPYPAQANSISPASLSVAALSIESSVPLASTLSTTHSLSHHQPDYSDQRVHFAPPIPASMLPESSHFAMPATSGTPRSFTNAASTSADNHMLGATPGLVDMMQNTPRPLDPAMVADDRTLADLLGWLDGPKAHDRMAAGQIDWIFGDSPEVPQLLDYSQLQDWTNFDLSGHPYSAQTPSASTLPYQPQPQQQPQQPSLLHQRHASISEPVQHQSPLFVLSSAAEMIELPQRTPQTRSQHVAQPSNDAQSTSGPRPGVDSPRHSIDLHHAGSAAMDPKTIAGRRSRWNSPDLADEDLNTSDSARSDPHEAKRDAPAADTDANDNLGLTPHVARRAKSSSGRRAAAIEAWPNRWNPAIMVNSLPAFSFTKASEEHLMSEDMAHVKRVSHSALLRMAEHLNNAASNPLERQRFDASFATLDAATLNVYLQLFFHHCYSFFPAIHQPTFHPDKCDPRLLAALCTIGAFFSEVPGSRNAAIYLASLTQMSVSRATLSNHALARVTSTFQSILLIYMVWRSVGVPSRQEYAEAFRGTYCTMIRRCRLLDNIPPPKLPSDATLDDRWMAWVSWESGRRTAWSTLASETELSMHWSLPEAFAPEELTGKLPCDDRLWEAPSAVEWAQTAMSLSSLHTGVNADPLLPLIVTGHDTIESFTWPDSSHQLDVGRVCDIIQRSAQTLPPGHPSSVTEQEREMVARLSPFSRLCIGSAVMLSTHHTMRMARFCTMLLGDEEQARQRMRKYLAAATDLLSTYQPRDARVDLLLHAIQLFELVSPEMLQVLSCRRGVPRMQAARQQLATELNAVEPWKTASIVYHAGQMLRLAKQSLQRAPVECLHIFYAAIALQAVSLLVLRQDALAPPGAKIVRIPLNGPAKFAAPPPHEAAVSAARGWRAGSSASNASSTSPSSVGGVAGYSTTSTGITATTPTDGRAAATAAAAAAGEAVKTTFMLESVGNLAHPMASERVLALASKWLRADDGVGVWPIGQSLAKILDSLATLTPRQSEA
ncbi:conserved hypothetical protein [Sporisorium reilianum SRZ2]|uniref:Zn(2)-C6 fungal-type domain-containing protein n=1 Tax=Sporisorium reilianum (strain SRZ2) TaxID=999809 RepID=E7A3C2_SPORE|nr:conserved hypothetical protein [Sporisorium reilianum SRZ2]